MKFIPMTLHYMRYSTKKFLDKFERSPFDMFDLYMCAPQLSAFDYRLKDLIDFARDVKRRGLSIYAVTPENCAYPCNFATQNEETRESSLRYYQRAIDTAQYLDCPNVQISIGFGYFDRPRKEAWSNTRDSLELLCEYAQKKGRNILLEENKSSTTQTIVYSHDIARMIKDVGADNLFGMVDTDQMTYAKETLDDYFANLGEKMAYVHFNDNGHTVPGHADFPMKQYYEDLKRNGYEGVCAAEICDRRYYIDPDKAIDDYISWLVANTEEFKDFVP